MAFPDGLTVLLVEDNPGDARLIREMLADTPGFSARLHHVDRLSQAFAILATTRPEVVLLDLSLPDSHGLETFLAVQDRVPQLPIVVLTGLNDEAVALQAVNAGAQDYLVKGEVQSKLLVRSLRYAIERKRLLTELESERAWLRTTIAHSPVGILLIEGSQGERIIPNPRAEEIFGFSFDPERGIAQCIELLCDAAGRPHPFEDSLIGRALNGEVTSLEEGMLWRLDGQEIPVAMSASPIADAGQRLIGAVLVIEDLTPLRELEKLRRQWLSVVGHEMRQASSLIGLQANVLQSQIEPTDRTSTTIGHILHISHHLGRMVSDLVDYSRIEARQLHVEPRVVYLPSLVDTVLERMTDVLMGRPVETVIASHIPEVWADPERLEQVLVNLLSNAAKYGTPGTPIRVQVACTEGELQVAVSNHGQGIAPGELPQLFTRFYRSPRAREEGITGLGLGLYISRGIIEAHGGRIWAESTQAQTITFCFALPAIIPQDHPSVVA